MADEAAWQCPACTLLNPTSSPACGVCETPCPLDLAGPKLTLSQPAPQAAAPPQPAAPHSPAPQPAAPQQPAPQRPAAAQRAAPAQHAPGVLEERRARAEELAAKQRAKEAERLLILRQAEADRRERLGLPVADAAPPAAASAAPAPPAAAAPGGLPQTVRLQVRCPHWSRTLMFTAFAPSSTLGDVRRCVRDELVNGVTATGDGRQRPDAAALAARVPEEGAITLVETVPPRRKFASQEDMQLTLLAAGLCPSSALLAEAPPVAVAEPEAPAAVDPDPTAAEGAHAGHLEDEDVEEAEEEEPGERSEEDGDEEEEEDDDDSDSAPPPGARGGRAPGGGWAFGGRGPRGAPGGGFGAGPSRPAGPRIGAGGQILGGPPQGGAAPVADAAAAAAARQERLAALERRSAAQAAERPPPAAAAPPASPASPPLEGKKRKEAEKEEIMRRIAEERADWAARHAPAAGSGSSAAAGAGPSGAVGHGAAVEATKRRLEPAAPAAGLGGGGPPPVQPPMPSQEASRVKGQMGGSSNKADRAREREAIMRQMEEDRASRLERQGAVTSKAAAEASSSTAAPLASASAAPGTASAVRLQIRCAATGRTVTTSSFSSESPLGAVRDFAAAELGVDLAFVESLALTYPPRTAFSTPEQMNTNLGALGLCPSATLLMRSTAPVAPAADELAAAEGATASMLIAETPASLGTAAEPACPAGHAMERFVPTEDVWCDMCQKDLPAGAPCYQCRACDFFQCTACSGLGGGAVAS